MESYSQRITAAARAIEAADFICVGAGAGLSAAAGLDYAGERFAAHFSDFIERYDLPDMYAGAFYPFPTPEETWAYWARHIDVNRFLPPALPLYKNLLHLVQGKDYFAITTNVESQLEKAGFSSTKRFEVQGNYAYLQCARPCHEQLYYNETQVKAMRVHTENCRIPSALVPRCPVCGGPMEVNLRKNDRFVEDDAWRAAAASCEHWLRKAVQGRLVLLELGVGFNTPGIIRYPFEQLTRRNPRATLVRLNRDHPYGPGDLCDRTLSFFEDLPATVSALLDELAAPAASR